MSRVCLPLDEQWLDFVSVNKNGTWCGEKYDLIIGEIANDDVYGTLQVYQNGLLTKEQALEALRIKNCLINMSLHPQALLHF